MEQTKGTPLFEIEQKLQTTSPRLSDQPKIVAISVPQGEVLMLKNGDRSTCCIGFAQEPHIHLTSRRCQTSLAKREGSVLATPGDRCKADSSGRSFAQHQRW